MRLGFKDVGSDLKKKYREGCWRPFFYRQTYWKYEDSIFCTIVYIYGYARQKFDDKKKSLAVHLAINRGNLTCEVYAIICHRFQSFSGNITIA